MYIGCCRELARMAPLGEWLYHTYFTVQTMSAPPYTQVELTSRTGRNPQVRAQTRTGHALATA